MSECFANGRLFDNITLFHYIWVAYHYYTKLHDITNITLQHIKWQITSHIQFIIWHYITSHYIISYNTISHYKSTSHDSPFQNTLDWLKLQANLLNMSISYCLPGLETEWSHMFQMSIFITFCLFLNIVRKFGQCKSDRQV